MEHHFGGFCLSHYLYTPFTSLDDIRSCRKTAFISREISKLHDVNLTAISQKVGENESQSSTSASTSLPSSLSSFRSAGFTHGWVATAVATTLKAGKNHPPFSSHGSVGAANLNIPHRISCLEEDLTSVLWYKNHLQRLLIHTFLNIFFNTAHSIPMKYGRLGCE